MEFWVRNLLREQQPHRRVPGHLLDQHGRPPGPGDAGHHPGSLELRRLPAVPHVDHLPEPADARPGGEGAVRRRRELGSRGPGGCPGPFPIRGSPAGGLPPAAIQPLAGHRVGDPAVLVGHHPVHDRRDDRRTERGRPRRATSRTWTARPRGAPSSASGGRSAPGRRSSLRGCSPGRGWRTAPPRAWLVFSTTSSSGSVPSCTCSRSISRACWTSGRPDGRLEVLLALFRQRVGRVVGGDHGEAAVHAAPASSASRSAGVLIAGLHLMKAPFVA